MTAGDLTSQLLLISGWAMPGAGGWLLLDELRGDASAWRPATTEEASALTATLAAMPAIARIHQGIVDRKDGHRGGCAALHFNLCDCRAAQVEPEED